VTAATFSCHANSRTLPPYLRRSTASFEPKSSSPTPPGILSISKTGCARRWSEPRLETACRNRNAFEALGSQAMVSMPCDSVQVGLGALAYGLLRRSLPAPSSRASSLFAIRWTISTIASVAEAQVQPVRLERPSRKLHVEGYGVPQEMQSMP